jgi:hypothetical protein
MPSELRVRSAGTTREGFWREHVQRQRSSGLTMSAYCRSQNLSRDTFIYWHRKLKKLVSAASGTEFALVPVQRDNAKEHAVLGLIVGERFRIEVNGDFSAPVLTKLVLTLERMR